MKTTTSKVLPTVMVVLSMIASIGSFILLTGDSKASYISGGVLLIMAISGIVGAAEIIDGRKKYALYLLKAFLAGNAIVWISAIWLNEQQMNVIFAFWAVALLFPPAFLKRWTLPTDIKMSQTTYSAAISIYQILLIVISIYGIFEISKLF